MTTVTLNSDDTIRGASAEWLAQRIYQRARSAAFTETEAVQEIARAIMLWKTGDGTMIEPTGWQPIETAPAKSSQRVDLWAKRWDAKTDRFEGCRFAAYYWVEAQKCWTQSGVLEVKNGGWLDEAPYRDRLPEGWHVTHWMTIPPAPKNWKPE